MEDADSVPHRLPDLGSWTATHHIGQPDSKSAMRREEGISQLQSFSQGVRTGGVCVCASAMQKPMKHFSRMNEIFDAKITPRVTHSSPLLFTLFDVSFRTQLMHPRISYAQRGSSKTSQGFRVAVGPPGAGGLA